MRNFILYIQKPRKIWFLIMLATLVFNACLFDTQNPETIPNKQLSYTLSVGSRGNPHCKIEIDLSAWPKSETRIFQAPKFYTDNPALPVLGIKAASLSLTDAKGKMLLARDTVIAGIELNGNFIALPPEAQTISYQIDLSPSDSSRFGIPFPGTGKGVEMIDGAYFFLLPLLGTDFVTQWRTPINIQLEFKFDGSRTLVGSDPVVHYQTNYELMFVRAVFDPLSSSTFNIRNHEVTIYSTSADSVTNRNTHPNGVVEFQTLLAKCIQLVEDSLLVLPDYRYFIGENSVFYGIEGSQGYWFRPSELTHPQTHIHELVHTFVGVYHSDLEDPWWKEGMTDYLGNLLALQGGFISDSDFVNEVLAPRDKISAVKNYSLANPYVRYHLFSPVDSLYQDQPDPENFVQLVYGKGAQASMILDRYIFERSRGKYSVFDLVKTLYHNHSPAFTRRDLVSVVTSYVSEDAEKFLHSLLDQAAPLPQDSLYHTYEKLKARGRFAPGVPPN